MKSFVSKTNEELISILLRTGTKDKSVKELSNSILKVIDDITELKNISITGLIQKLFIHIEIVKIY